MKTAKKAIVISGLPGVGKSTLSKKLAEQMNGHHVGFTRMVAGKKQMNVPIGMWKIMRFGRRTAVEKGLKKSYEEFLQTGKTTIILDGALHPMDVRILQSIDPTLEIHLFHITLPSTKKRVELVRLRKISKGGGKSTYTRLWIWIMDLLHRPGLKIAHLQQLQKKSTTISNNGTPDELVAKVKHALNGLEK